MTILTQHRRRIRSRAVLLSSSRRREKELDHWMQLESAKGFIPAISLVLLHMSGLVSVPEWLVVGSLAMAATWMAMVYFDALTMAARVNTRRAKLLRQKGVECRFLDQMLDRRAWSSALQGKTLRQYLDGK